MPAETHNEFRIPTPLVEQIKLGDTILFLGAGANDGAIHPENDKIPITGSALAEYLSERFFNRELTGRSLSDVAKFAESEFGLPRLQEVIASKFNPFSPAEYHKIICQYPWHAIATTNYDLIVEKAYDQGRVSASSA